jgi:hypothetical protein
MATELASRNVLQKNGQREVAAGDIRGNAVKRLEAFRKPEYSATHQTAGELQSAAFPGASWAFRGIVILSEAKDFDAMQGFAPSYKILRCAQNDRLRRRCSCPARNRTPVAPGGPVGVKWQVAANFQTVVRVAFIDVQVNNATAFGRLPRKRPPDQPSVGARRPRCITFLRHNRAMFWHHQGASPCGCPEVDFCLSAEES